MVSRLSGIFMLCIFPCWLVAQQGITLGARVNGSFGTHSTSELDKLANNITNNSTTVIRSLSGDIFIEFENSSRIYYRTSIGYKRQRSKNSSHNEFISESTEEYSSDFQISEIRIAEGLGIHRVFDRINLRLGIEVPFIYRQSERYSDVREQFNKNGVSQRVDKRFYDRPKIYTVGLMLFSGVYYALWESISVGIELSNGIKYSFSKGSYTINYESYDPMANRTSTVLETVKINNRSYNIAFLETSIGFLVRF